MNSLTTCISAALMLAPLAAPLPVHASDCTRTSTGFTPLNEFATGEKYLSLYEGGLYPGNQNELPTSHLIRGLTEAKTIKPRAANGTVSANGRIILMSIGMSNTTQEWCAATSITQPCGATSFMAQAAELDTINFNQVTLIDGAKASQVSTQWDQPTDANYDRIRDTILTPQGLSEAQVQGVWVKVANAGPTVRLPSAGADAFAFKVHLGNIARAASALSKSSLDVSVQPHLRGLCEQHAQSGTLRIRIWFRCEVGDSSATHASRWWRHRCAIWRPFTIRRAAPFMGTKPVGRWHDASRRRNDLGMQ